MEYFDYYICKNLEDCFEHHLNQKDKDIHMYSTVMIGKGLACFYRRLARQQVFGNFFKCLTRVHLFIM